MTISGECQIEFRAFRTQSTGHLRTKIWFQPRPVYFDPQLNTFKTYNYKNRLSERGFSKLVDNDQRLCTYNFGVFCLGFDFVIEWDTCIDYFIVVGFE